MKSGTAVGLTVLTLGGIALAGGLYLVNFYHWDRVRGVEMVTIGGESFAVSGYDGLDNTVLPTKLRACFRLEDPQAALAAGAAPRQDAGPFTAPFWFDCWDAETIGADVAAGRARIILAERVVEGEFATERYVAIYEDGRAFMWRGFVEDD